MSGGPGIPWTTVEKALHAWVIAGTGLAGTAIIWGAQGRERPTVTPAPYITMRLGPILRRGLDWIRYTPAPLTLTPIAITGEAGGILAAPSHGLRQGDGPVQVMTTGTVPTGLALLTNYWAIPIDFGHLQLASTFQNAWVPTPVVVTDAGTGTVTLVSTSDTRRAGAELNANSEGMRKVTLSLQAFGGTATGGTSPTALLDAVVSRLPQQIKIMRPVGIGVTRCGPVRVLDGVVYGTVMEPRAAVDFDLSLLSTVQDPETIIERAKVDPTVDGVDEPEFIAGLD